MLLVASCGHAAWRSSQFLDAIAWQSQRYRLQSQSESIADAADAPTKGIAMAEMRHRQPSVPVMSIAPTVGTHDADAGRVGEGVLRQLQEACDDLYCAPLDREAQEQVRDLLLRTTPSLHEVRLRARRIKVACDELHDDPDDLDARYTLLSLLDTPA